MKISFVIPAHNEEHYLAACLEAIIRQKPSLPCEIEIIVVDNASTDGTAAVAARFTEVRIVHEPQKGLSAARQAGFDASSGELIANIDADSIVPDGWIDTVISEFSKNPHLVGLSGPFVYYDLTVVTNVFVQLFYAVGFSFLNRFILGNGVMLQGGNFVIKREALLKIHGYNIALDFHGEDSDIARRLNTIGPLIFTFRLPMYTSGRRLAGEGLLQMGWKYMINHVWTIFFKKPFHAAHRDIRSEQTKGNASFKTTIPQLYKLLVSIAWTIAALVLLEVLILLFIHFAY